MMGFGGSSGFFAVRLWTAEMDLGYSANLSMMSIEDRTGVLTRLAVVSLARAKEGRAHDICVATYTGRSKPEKRKKETENLLALLCGVVDPHGAASSSYAYKGARKVPVSPGGFS
jgi:hypothetical protein